MSQQNSYIIMMVGGAGDMARVTTKMMLSLFEEGQIVIADIDLDKAKHVAALFGTPQVP